MGQKNSRSLTLQSDFNPHDWINQNYVSNNDPAISQFGKMTTLKNRNSQQLVDKYQQMFISQKDYQDYLHSFEWRRQQAYIVQAEHIETRNKNRYCSTTYQVDIYIEHPKNRLSDFSDIPFPDDLYVLKAMLMGYAKLFQHVGSFPIRQQQVCINDKGYVKVWFNKDLSKNYPQQWEIQPVGHAIQQQQEDMVSQIIAIVAKNSDTELEPTPTFIQFYQKSRQNIRIGFDQALQLVQQYAQRNNEQIPQNFKSVVQVYQHQQGLYQVQGNNDTNNTNDNEENHDIIGQITQRQIQLRNQSYAGSQVQKITNRSMKSRQSKVSQIDNLQKYSSHIGGNPNQNELVIMNQTGNSNQNKGQAYRLSGLSRLQDNAQMPQTYQPSTQYQPSSQFQPTAIYQPTGNINRQSQMSNVGNYTQISYNAVGKQTDSPVWLSLKPQQPYIPSSPAYINLQAPSTQNQNQTLRQSTGLLPNNLQTLRTQSRGNLNASRPNHSISQRPQQTNLSLPHQNQQIANMKFSRQLQQQIKRDQYEIEIRQRKNSNKLENNQLQTFNNFHDPQLLLNKTQSQNSGISTEKQNYRNSNYNNQFKTAQFIQNGMQHTKVHPQQNSNYNYQNTSNFSNNNNNNISHNQSGQFATIIIKSPSQRNISFNSFNNGYPQNYNGFYEQSGQPIRMVKNNSQPFIAAVPTYPPTQAYKVLSPPPPSQFNTQYNNNMPISPKSLPPQSPPQSPQLNSFIYQQPFSQSPLSPSNIINNHIPFRQQSNNINTNSNTNTNANIQNNKVIKIRQSKQSKQRKSIRYSQNNTEIDSVFCTVKQQIPLDPQIYNDMLIYI